MFECRETVGAFSQLAAESNAEERIVEVRERNSPRLFAETEGQVKRFSRCHWKWSSRAGKRIEIEEEVVAREVAVAEPWYLRLSSQAMCEGFHNWCLSCSGLS